MKDFREPNKSGIARKQRPSRISVQLFCQKKVKLKKMNMKIDNILCKLQSPILRSSISVLNPSSIGICDVFFRKFHQDEVQALTLPHRSNKIVFQQF